METRAAIATEAGKPLSIETVTLEGPREGEVLSKLSRQASAIRMPIHCRVPTLRDFPRNPRSRRCRRRG